METKLLRWVLVLATATLVACGAGPGFGGDASDSDADPFGDAADDHKTGFKIDGGSDADPGDVIADAAPGDGSATSDASDAGATSTKRVFTTAPNEYYIGSTGVGHFQGLAGADGVCQQRATAANLGGTWKAWLSSSATSAAQRLAHNGSPYQLIDGTVIATDWTSLTSGTLQHKIDQNELAQQWTSAVFWTSTNANGTALSATCGDWAVATSSSSVNYGLNDRIDSRWTNEAMTTCADHMAFYCIEQ